MAVAAVVDEVADAVATVDRKRANLHKDNKRNPPPPPWTVRLTSRPSPGSRRSLPAPDYPRRKRRLQPRNRTPFPHCLRWEVPGRTRLRSSDPFSFLFFFVSDMFHITYHIPYIIYDMSHQLKFPLDSSLFMLFFLLPFLFLDRFVCSTIYLYVLNNDSA